MADPSSQARHRASSGDSVGQIAFQIRQGDTVGEGDDDGALMQVIGNLAHEAGDVLGCHGENDDLCAGGRFDVVCRGCLSCCALRR
nr:hypothetical protein [Rhodococcus triatomae]